MMNAPNGLALSLTALFALLIGCSDPGPAERAGKNIDEAVEAVKESVDPDGPAQSAGREIDEAAERAGRKIEETAEKLTKGD